MAAPYDLVVIGGGPGGATLASLVAMQGHRVLLLEKERFPRHQIGESLLPATVHGICRLLGLSEQLAEAGFQKKRGGTFLWGSSSTPWTFAFSKVVGSAIGYAYQVERSRFDKLLLDNAAQLGVEVKEEAAVSEIVLENGRACGVRHSGHNGSTNTIHAKFVADAGGHGSQFHRLMGRRVLSKFFQNVALYGYFSNGKRLPEPNSGNILCAAFTEGWFWYIPLSATLTSVGAVVSRDAAQKIQDGKDRAFYEYVNCCPIICDYLSHASRITDGQYGTFRIRKDYSYCNTRFYKDGLILIGDAACFVDPVFSSGVHLATYSALLAARSVNTCLVDSLSEEMAFREFEQRYRREFANFYRFLSFFYDMNRNEKSYFWAARKILDTPEAPDHAFIRLVSGLSAAEDQALSACDPCTERLGSWFDAWKSHSQAVCEGVDSHTTESHTDLTGFDFDNFMPGLSEEITQIQLQAFFGPARPTERPIEKGGLIPSVDGFQWVKAAH